MKNKSKINWLILLLLSVAPARAQNTDIALPLNLMADDIEMKFREIKESKTGLTLSSYKKAKAAYGKSISEGVTRFNWRMGLGIGREEPYPYPKEAAFLFQNFDQLYEPNQTIRELFRHVSETNQTHFESTEGRDALYRALEQERKDFEIQFNAFYQDVVADLENALLGGLPEMKQVVSLIYSFRDSGRANGNDTLYKNLSWCGKIFYEFPQHLTPVPPVTFETLNIDDLFNPTIKGCLQSLVPYSIFNFASIGGNSKSSIFLYLSDVLKMMNTLKDRYAKLEIPLNLPRDVVERGLIKRSIVLRANLNWGILLITEIQANPQLFANMPYTD